MIKENEIMDTLKALNDGQKILTNGQRKLEQEMRNGFEGLLAGQINLQEQIQDISGDVEYLKRKTDHIETRQEEMWNSIQFIEKRTREDDDTLATEVVKIKKELKSWR